MRGLLLVFSFLCALSVFSTVKAQAVMAVGTYGLASSAIFGNESSFGSSPALFVTEGVYEVQDGAITALASLRIQGGGSTALLTMQFDVGYTEAGLASFVMSDCVQNPIEGPSFGIDLCVAANSANGCATTINWGQATVNEPFPNRTLIVMAKFCGLEGTQMWQCGAIGGCDGVPPASNSKALPIGNFLLDGVAPPFVYPSQTNLVDLQNASLSAMNNFEYSLALSFAASGPTSILVKIYGAVVPDQNSELLFSLYNCSQSFSGPDGVDICSLLTLGGCEEPVADSQLDLDPPNNETAIQLPQWCLFYGTIQFKCSGTCEGPINRATSPTGIGFIPGNCLAFDGNVLQFNPDPSGCDINNLVVNQLTVNQLNSTNFTVVNQVVQNLTVVNQVVENQIVQQQVIIEQTITNQTVLEQTVVNQVVQTLNATNINIQFGETDEWRVNRLYMQDQQDLFYYNSGPIETFISFLDENGLPCGNAYNPGTGYPYPIPVTITLQRVGSLVNGLMTFDPSGNAAAQTGETTCTYIGTGPAQLPNFARPTAIVTGRSAGFLVYPDGTDTCTVNMRLLAGPTGRLYWLPHKSATSPCGTRDDLLASDTYTFNKNKNFIIGSDFLSVSPPGPINQFDFSYTLDNVD